MDESDYEWWDIDESGIAAAVYAILAPIQLGDRDYTDWHEFASNHPGAAYAWKVGQRHDALRASVVSLRLVQKLVKVNDGLPLPTPVGHIDRYEWARLCVDTLLFRFSSIRDQAFHLANEVRKLGITDRALTLDHLEKVAADAPFLRPLRQVASAGEGIRRERDGRAHQGFQRPITRDRYFELLSLSETAQRTGPPLSIWGFNSGGDFVEESNADAYDLKASYVEIMRGLTDEFLPACRSLLEHLSTFLDALYEDFEARYASLQLP